MFCKNCGKELPDGIKFCTSCGAKIDSSETKNDNAVGNNANKSIKLPKFNPLFVVIGIVATIAIVILCNFMSSSGFGAKGQCTRTLNNIKNEAKKVTINDWDKFFLKYFEMGDGDTYEQDDLEKDVEYAKEYLDEKIDEYELSKKDLANFDKTLQSVIDAVNIKVEDVEEKSSDKCKAKVTMQFPKSKIMKDENIINCCKDIVETLDINSIYSLYSFDPKDLSSNDYKKISDSLIKIANIFKKSDDENKQTVKFNFVVKKSSDKWKIQLDASMFEPLINYVTNWSDSSNVINKIFD